MDNGKMIDSERIKIIDQLSEDQKGIFLLGMCLHSAVLTYFELEMDKIQTISDHKELEEVKKVLKKNKIKCRLTNG